MIRTDGKQTIANSPRDRRTVPDIPPARQYKPAHGGFPTPQQDRDEHGVKRP